MLFAAGSKPSSNNSSTAGAFDCQASLVREARANGSSFSSSPGCDASTARAASASPRWQAISSRSTGVANRSITAIVSSRPNFAAVCSGE